MTNRYETVFILTPVLSEDQAKEAVTKFKDLLKEGNGKVRHEENWGMRKLAYPIQKKSSGFYHLIEFESDPSFIAKLGVCSTSIATSTKPMATADCSMALRKLSQTPRLTWASLAST